MTDQIKLRPVTESDLEPLGQFSINRELSEPFEWTGFHDPTEHKKNWEENGYLGDDYSLLTVALRDDSFAGFVCWWPAGSPTPSKSIVEIGILLRPEHRGHGWGLAAQQLLVDYLFATTPVHRVQAHADVENTVERKLLERLGFQLEGISRGMSFACGEWHDETLYSRLREDPPPVPE